MNQEEIKKKQTRVMIYVMIISLICVVGVSYAFFTAGMSSETSTTVRADAGTMKITYDGGKEINLAGIYPKDNVWATKTITVTGNNTTDADMYYKLTLVVDSNTFITDDPLQYELVSTNTSTNGDIIPNISKTDITGTSIELGSGHFVKANNAKHTYQLKIYYPRQTYSQDENQNAEFSSHVQIKSITKPKKIEIQRGALKNKIFNTKEPGELQVQFICNNSDQKPGGVIPVAECLYYEISGAKYLPNENAVEPDDKYIIELSDYIHNAPILDHGNGGDVESISINLTQDLINNYKGKIPFDYKVRSSMYTTLDIRELGQKFWLRLYFIDSEGDKHLIDWYCFGNSNAELDVTKEDALTACKNTLCAD